MLESLANNIFTYTKLTEEEQRQRKILGRLVGVIADSQNPTRNERKYGAELWENVFNNPIMQEKIENRCCFGELGHPADREEIDPEKIAICLAEFPKMGNDGKLYGVFDILDTPCGKILKVLCDYGTNIGVSSRGSGDVMPNNEVDPETYYCECWDAVIIPAVKTARPKYVTESLDTKSLKMRRALTESYNNSSDEDKAVMKQAFEDLDIVLEDTDMTNDFEGKDVVVDFENLEKIDENLTEDKENDNDEANNDEADDEDYGEQEDSLVNELKDIFDKVDADAELEIEPIKINDIEYNLTMLAAKPDKENNKIILTFGYDPEETDDNIDNDEAAEEEAEATEEVIDDKSLEVLENLKEAIRQRNTLDTEVKNLKNEKAVHDVEVKKLKEEIDQYKLAFMRTSKIAATAKEQKADIAKLNEQLDASKKAISDKDEELKKLKAKTALSESLRNKDVKLSETVKQLTEAQAAKEAEIKQLNEQANSYKQKAIKNANIAQKYKAETLAVLEEYTKFRASMLGVTPNEITRKLNENYTISDINKVCDEILESHNPQVSIGNTNFAGVSFSQAHKKQNPATSEYGYGVDDDLLILAGLK